MFQKYITKVLNH